ncbi:MAG: UDP-N-acetylglucosamine 1-carboxyvinyltransferase [bacterium]|nr:UDP-N-acetylglucosamine 1-carboxyvinyltransferase [bacterium]
MKFTIQGGRKLEGEIAVNGSKNAATPIVAATLLTDQPVVLENVPKIGDVLKMIEILKSCGSQAEWLDERTIRIQNKEIDPSKIDQSLVKQIRSSILLVGPMLARFKKFRFAIPGGCQIGARSIDTHLEAFECLGAKTEFDSDSGLYEVSLDKPLRQAQDRPNANQVILKEFSVTATENLLMLGTAYPLEIRMAACEPHVQDLGNFLAKVFELQLSGLGTHQIIIRPKSSSKVSPIRHKIISDPIEAGTFAVLAAVTRSKILIKNVDCDYLDAPLGKLKEFGVVWQKEKGDLLVNGKLSVLQSVKIQTLPYPGLPTDLQAPFGVLATQASGRTLIFDTMYEGRLRYIQELKAMGADAEVLDSHRAVINGPTVLHSAEIESLDLRAGATLVIAALVASGKSVIGHIEQIDRGYEDFDGRLIKLGADIQRVN